MKQRCSASNCDRPRRASGYCNAHYQRAYRTGNARAGDMIEKRAPHATVTFGGAHLRTSALWGSASQYPCVECGNPAKDWAYDGSDPAQCYGANHGKMQLYSLHPEFYMPMCRSCHSSKDRTESFEELAEYRALKHETGLSLAEIRAIIDRALKHG
jgi:hypothetical protein